MTAPQPSEQQQQQPAPLQAAPIPAQQDSDRILTPEETENLLRGYALDSPPTPEEQEQSQMVREFLGQSAPAGAQPPAQPPQQQAPQPPQQVPPQPTPQPPPTPEARFVEAAVQASQQMGGPTPQQTPPQSVPVQQQQSPEMAALQAELSLMRTQYQAMQQQLAAAQQPQPQRPPQQQPGAPQAPVPDQQGQLPIPQFNIPDSHMNALRSEDPNISRAALNEIMNVAVATAINQIRQESQYTSQQTLQQIQPLIDRSLGDFRIQQDMYGTYPELSNFRGYVEAAARQLEPQFAHIGWGPDYRDAIAERVAPMVPGVYQKIQANRAARVGFQPPPQQFAGQPLPQQQPQALPPGVTPVGIAGATHGQPVPQGQQPVLARDAYGNYVPIQQPPQPYLGSPQTRPDGSQVPAEIMDIWQTLGYVR